MTLDVEATRRSGHPHYVYPTPAVPIVAFRYEWTGRQWIAVLTPARVEHPGDNT